MLDDVSALQFMQLTQSTKHQQHHHVVPLHPHGQHACTPQISCTLYAHINDSFTSAVQYIVGQQLTPNDKI